MRYFSANNLSAFGKMRYKIFKEEFIDEHGLQYFAYGIEFVKGEKTVNRISDITCSYQKIKKLCSLCNRLKLDELHLSDIVEDFLCK